MLGVNRVVVVQNKQLLGMVGERFLSFTHPIYLLRVDLPERSSSGRRSSCGALAVGHCVVYCSSCYGAWKGCFGYQLMDKVYGHGDSRFHAYLDGVHASVCNGCSDVGIFNGVSGYSAEAYYVAGILGYDHYPTSTVFEQRPCLEIVSCPV